MHALAVILVAWAGLSGVLTAVLHWRTARSPAWLLWSGFIALTLGVMVAATDSSHRDLLYGSLSVWAAFAAVLFVVRAVAAPSPWLIALPAGAVTLMVAVAGLAETPAADDSGIKIVVLIHVIFQLAHAGAMLVAAGAAGTWLLAATALKKAEPTALRLPALPVLERFAMRFAVTATALLIGGVATGGAAMMGSQRITLFHPAVIAAVLTLVILSSALGAFLLRGLGRRGFHLYVLLAAVTAAAGMVILVIGHHG